MSELKPLPDMHFWVSRVLAYLSALLGTRDAAGEFVAVATLSPVPDRTAATVTQAFAAIGGYVS